MKLSILFLWISIFSLQPKQSRGVHVNDIASLPWNVIVWVKTDWWLIMCSGSILDDQHVLTAAQCLCTNHRKMKSIIVITSSMDIRIYYQTRYTAHYYATHPKYPWYSCFKDNYDPKYDMVVVRTTRKMRLFDKAQPINVRFDEISSNSTVVTMGYGCDEKGSNGKLHYAFITASSNCDMGLTCIPENIKQASLCSGDFGGPLVICHNGLKECEQIGVAISSTSFVSTHSEEAFIKNARKNIGYRRI